MTTRVDRLPFAPLAARIGVTAAHVLAVHLGTHARQIYRWRAYGIDVWSADRVATRIGLHPCQVWSDWDELALEAAS